jgi:AcrR family transcriptional regulator
MGAAFTAAEQARITESLVETGEQLFIERGLSKTSLAQLVAPAGIAKASFYSFFASKESLYLEIMIRRAPRIAESMAPLLEQRPDAEGLVALMKAHVEVLETDPWYRRLLTHPEELHAVQGRVGAAELARVTPHVITPILEFVRRGQQAGLVIDSVTPSVLLGVLRSVGLIVMHRDEFGAEYEQVLQTTIEALAAGLTLARRPKRGGPHAGR